MTRFFSDENGATAIEYALIAASIVLIISSTIVIINPQVKMPYERVHNAFTTAQE